MEIDSGGGGELSQVGVEINNGATTLCAIVESPSWHWEIKHFFETKGLGAELDAIAVVGLGPTAFIFDGEDRIVLVEFHDIGNAA